MVRLIDEKSILISTLFERAASYIRDEPNCFWNGTSKENHGIVKAPPFLAGPILITWATHQIKGTVSELKELDHAVVKVSWKILSIWTKQAPSHV